MAVDSVNTAAAKGQTIVEMKFADQTIKIPCNTPEEAKKVAEEVKVLEQQLHEEAKKHGMSDKEFMAQIMQHAPKAQGQGDKLDIKAA